MSNKKYNTLAFDFGASSGRAIVGSFDGEKIELSEIHRFPNDPVFVGGTMYWDVLRLFHEIKQGLLKSRPYNIKSLGIDTWGVDFGLLDKDGKLLENPVHYRDKRNIGMLNKAFSYISQEELYNITGNQFMEINTAFQLLSLKLTRPDLLSRADKMLLMPDLFRYFLTGEKTTEYSIASTTQLLDAENRCWSKRVIDALSLPEGIFCDIVPTGSAAGTLSDEICEELSIQPCAVTAVAGHDTQCAMVAVPTEKDDFIFLSCGTWSLLGTELSEPLINEKTLRCNVTNEGGYGGKASFLKNIIGLWLIQETRRQWQKEGDSLSFAEMETLARNAKPFSCFIDPDAPDFVAAGNIPERIRAYCRRTGQYVPKSKGEILRCIYESLAMKYRYAAEQIEFCTGKEYDTIYIVGGGTKDKLLSSFTASACNKNVSAGPTEATVLGNIALQLLAEGKIKTLRDARRIISNSEEVTSFTPSEPEAWNKKYQTFKEVVSLA